MKENEIKIFSVIVDAEGNDKWVSNGVFVDKPKLKQEKQKEPVKGVNDRLLKSIMDATGLTKEGVLIHRTEINPLNSHGIEILIHYYLCMSSYEMRKKSIMIYV